MTCKADIKQMSNDEVMAYYSARVAEWVASGRFPVSVNEDGTVDAPEVIAKVNEELATFDAEGAWSAKCGCGWQGNDPYPSKASAVSSLEAHYESVRRANG